jgi:tRNA1Val (adenine37-N6)-methyltransferase
LKACSENSFFCKRKTTVFSKENQPAKRMLLEIVKTECITLQDELVIEHAGRHNYTEEYKRLTKDFYLNF